MADMPTIPGAAAGGEPPADPSLPRTWASDILDGFVRFIGQVASWIWIVLVLVILYNVVQRYAFGVGSIWLEELQWHLYAIGFIIGLSYAVVSDRHVRVDVVAERLRPKTRAVIEVLGILLLFLPFTIAILYAAIPFVETSYRLNERSSAPGGLPYRWIIKSFILWGFGLLIIAAFSRLLRCMALLIGWPRPIWPRG